MTQFNFYLNCNFKETEALERQYNYLPNTRKITLIGLDHYCLNKTLNLARLRQRGHTDLGRLEQILAESRQLAEKKRVQKN